MRRKTGLLKSAATESLTLSIELFNRPVETGRQQSVVLLAAHSFEMLLKAIIYQERGRIRDKGDLYSYGLEKTINICIDDLEVLQPDDRTVLMALKQDRDAAAHDVVAMSDEMLWIHLRSAVDIFDRVLKEYFNESLETVLPRKVLPVAVEPPSDVGLVVDHEIEHIRRLLAPGTRKSAEARSMLRPLLALDGAVSGRSDAPSERELNRAQRGLRDGKAWHLIFPGLAQLELVGAPEDADTHVALRLSRDPDGIPVRRATDEDDEALVYREVNVFDKYSIKLSQFGAKLGLGRNEGLALIDALDLKDDPDCFYVKRTRAGNVQFQGLSARALEIARKALADSNFDLTVALAAYNRKTSGRAVS